MHVLSAIYGSELRCVKAVNEVADDLLLSVVEIVYFCPLCCIHQLISITARHTKGSINACGWFEC